MKHEQFNKDGEINLRIFLLARIHCSIEEESVNCFLDQNSLVGIMMLRFSRQLATQSLKGKSGFVADGFYFLSLTISPSGPDTTP